MVLLRAGRRMTGSESGSVGCVCVVLQVSKRFRLEDEERERERRREERGDLREVSASVFVVVSRGAMDDGGVSMTPLLEENCVSRLEGVMGRGGRDWEGISYPGSDRVWWRGSP
jgi:hypothetical protein